MRRKRRFFSSLRLCQRPRRPSFSRSLSVDVLKLRKLAAHLQIVEARRLLEMRLDEIGHNVEDRIGPC